MTIYWERCSICGDHRPTLRCTLDPGLKVCPRCCLACPKRDECPRPAWFPEAHPSTRGEAVEDREKLLEELLSRLGGRSSE